MKIWESETFMDKFKSKVIKLAVSGVAIFAIGIFVGYQLNYGTLSSIQGYLFNAAGPARVKRSLRAQRGTCTPTRRFD